MTRIIFYASSHQKKVVGEAVIDGIFVGAPEEIWKIARAVAGITKKFYSSCYAGIDKAVAYKLKDVIVYDTPRELSDFGVRQAPRSFVYLD